MEICFPHFYQTKTIVVFSSHIHILQSLATPEAFSRNPSRVWEFYHYRREVMLTKNPNAAHLAIAECEERLRKQGREVTVVTQNIDELHRRAGSKNILEIHGKLTIITTDHNCCYEVHLFI